LRDHELATGIQLGAAFDAMAGMALILVPVRRHRLLIGTLVPATLFHLDGIAMGAFLIVIDNVRDSQWSGVATALGLVMAVPCLLMLILGMFAMTRVLRARKPAL